MQAYTYPVYEYVPQKDRTDAKAAPVRYPVVVVGAGPVGLTAALDLQRQGIPVVLLDEDNTVSVGSRAVCYSKRALEVWDRLGVAEPIVEKGITWKKGKVFYRDDQVFEFDLLPEDGHKMPAFINLQQYHLEEFLISKVATCSEIDVRWKNKLVGLERLKDRVRLTVDTPDGSYTLECDWLIAADGARSTVRNLMGLEFKGTVFNDRFLICDVFMKSPLPAERRFWFDPPFNKGRTALMHLQADDLWRLDFQLGPDADPEVEMQHQNAAKRIRAMLGDDVDFEIEWTSVYTYVCMRLDKFRHGPVLFVGDSAHQVSPFGARGANSGVQDVDNLIWKLRRVMDGTAPDSLLDTYGDERIVAADENILNSTRSTDFIVPKSDGCRAYRDAVLSLAKDHDFAKKMINSGRLSVPAVLRNSSLNTPDRAGEVFAGTMVPGAACLDAPFDGGWLLDRLNGNDFALLAFDTKTEPMQDMTVLSIDCKNNEQLARRYGAESGTVYLIRPDQHVAARWKQFDRAAIEAARKKALGR